MKKKDSNSLKKSAGGYACEQEPMLKTTLDTNCLIRYFEHDDEFVIQLVRYGLERKIDLAITTKAYTDIERDKLDKRKESMLKKLESFPVLGTGARWSISKWNSGDFWISKEYATLATKIQEILFPSLSSGDARFKTKICDIDHLAGHIWTKRNFFVTYDENFLRKHTKLAKISPAQICKPKECVTRIKELEAEDL